MGQPGHGHRTVIGGIERDIGRQKEHLFPALIAHTIVAIQAIEFMRYLRDVEPCHPQAERVSFHYEQNNS